MNEQNPEQEDPRKITRGQWYAIGFVICLLIAMFLLMHGA